jgi:hypothetical protein
MTLTVAENESVLMAHVPARRGRSQVQGRFREQFVN